MKTAHFQHILGYRFSWKITDRATKIGQLLVTNQDLVITFSTKVNCSIFKLKALVANIPILRNFENLGNLMRFEFNPLQPGVTNLYPGNHQKAFRFLMFSGRIDKQHRVVIFQGISRVLFICGGTILKASQSLPAKIPGCNGNVAD